MIINYEKIGIKSLSHSEKTVINYINEHNEEMATLTIGKLAEKTFTSTSTVSRAIHKCGFESINRNCVEKYRKTIYRPSTIRQMRF